MEPKWLDAPFFNLLEDFASLQTYFMAQALFIAKIVITLNIGFMAIKYAIKGEGFKEPVVKLLTSLILFLIIINSYPLMIRGLNRVIYDWSYGSTYGKVAEMIQKTTDSGETSEFWAKKEKDPDAYSDIIKVLVEKTGNGNIAKKYVLDIFDRGSDNRPGMFIRPNAVMRLLMLTFENIWNKVLTCLKPKGKIPFPQDPGGAVILTLTGFALLLGGIFASMQYFICAIEFTLITSVGCILLPFMLWDGTKFLTEKLVGAIVGQALKLLFITLAFMLTINGFLALMVREFDGHIDQAIYTLFTVFFYWMLCQHGPALATALLTGTPQLSMAEGLQTAGSMAGAAVAGAAGVKAVASGAVKTGTQAKSAINKAQGAAQAAKESGKSQAGAVMGSLAGSAKDSVKSGMHGLARSLTRGKSSTGGGGASAGSGNQEKPEPTKNLNNRYSTLERRNASNENGNRKTGKEFGAESKQMGYDRYMNNQQAKTETANQKAAADWKAQIQNKAKPEEEPKRYDGGTPLGQNIPQRNTGEDK